MHNEAYLMILDDSDTPMDENQIHEEILGTGFTAVHPFENYAVGKDGLLVVWRFDPQEKFTDEAVLELVGAEGGICYMGPCPICNMRTYKIEHPFHHERDSGIFCSCDNDL